MADLSALFLLHEPGDDWEALEALLNLEPEALASPVPVVDYAPGCSTGQPNSITQNPLALINSHFPQTWVQKSLEQEDTHRNLTNIDYFRSETGSAAPSRPLLETELLHDNLRPAASLTISSTTSLKSTKRKIDDFSSSFSAVENSSQPQRKRQAFSPERREQVAKTRKIRACQRCKMRKLSVSFLSLRIINSLK